MRDWLPGWARAALVDGHTELGEIEIARFDSKSSVKDAQRIEPNLIDA
jgi:hypothetical protein